MPRIYSPGASVNDDYAHICDNCQKDDGRPTLGWTLSNGRYFDLCYSCLETLFLETLPRETIVVMRTIISEELRNEIFERDGYQCVHCSSIKNLEVDHIVPFSTGGKTIISNLQTLCKKCNSRKGTKKWCAKAMAG